ncbi:hypothetical protein CVT26_010672 [Gymnopilus dilepis]|uniref:G-protein coupled receptors family 1 profile domain-containing protein n=1 Tax=Gymnopilus dilepis TaxID=231916 RepID=A0A409Y0V2_9AGAR|nr:hypothetical protein CVT26_010672 [Gymnopilus dilepis]
MMSDSTYPLFPVFAFFGFFLPLVPLPWHLQALNSGTCFYIFWSSLGCLNQFINSIVWAGNALNPAPAWCEISIRIIMASSVGIPAASLCINRRLYLIASVRGASVTPAQKHRAILIDCLICLLLPLAYVALQYTVQGHRFNILEDIGCYPALYNTVPTFFITNMCPLGLGLISAVYCLMTLRSFSRRRAEFSQFLTSNTSLTLSRYFRLMALAMTEICATTPLSIFTIWLNATATPIHPWISLADTHFGYSRVEQIPAIIWRSQHLVAVGTEFSRWVTVVCAFIFFGFFGFASEAKRNYRLAWHWFKRMMAKLGIKARPRALLSSKMKAIGVEEDTLPVSSFALYEFKAPEYSTSIKTGEDYSVFDPATPASSTVVFSPFPKSKPPAYQSEHLYTPKGPPLTMVLTLAIASFICTTLLPAFLFSQRLRTVPGLAVVLWLIIFNLLHGVNAVILATNVDVHIPAWCDVATKLMLGTDVAIPGAFLCSAMRLELVSSSRAMASNPKVLRNRTILEIMICYFLPVIYMLLHLIGQDRRFDLIQGYGCFPSTHPSTLAFLLVWIPPLTMSGIAFVFYGISIHNIGVLRGTYLTAHLEARSTMNSSIFYRRLITGMILTGALILISLSSLFSVHSFQPWTSWNDVHSQMSQIEIVTSPDDIINLRFSWWAYFAISCLYIFLSLIIGEETRDIYRWLRDLFKGRNNLQRKLVLPLYARKKKTAGPEMTATAQTQSRPLTLELKSGWDDRWDSKPVRKGSKRSATSVSSSTSCQSPTNEMMDEDLEFMSSTLSYLGSPAARSLGITSPISTPPPAKIAQPRTALEIPFKPSSPPPLPLPKCDPTLMTPNVLKDVNPPINSVFDANWPIPPSSPTPSIPRSYHRSDSRSRSRSPVSSADDVPSPYNSCARPVRPGSRPFADSYAAPSMHTPPPSIRSPTKKTVPKRPSLRALRRTWSKEHLGEERNAPEVIHMTIVRETA